MPLQLRTLVSGEEERLLELLDGWPFGDDTRGSVFFRRYLEQDPSYQPDNIWVAADGPQPVSCVQIFPRQLRVRGGRAGDRSVAESCGGIGTVFTEPSYRRQGLGGELLSLATGAMRKRGFGLSALLATRVDWYQSHGWHPWCSYQWRLRVVDREWLAELAQRPGGVAAETAVESLQSDVSPTAEQLTSMLELRQEFCRTRLGTVLHDSAGWAATLDLAGNPGEEIRLAPAQNGGLAAYLRTTELYGDLQFLEWAWDQRDGHRQAGLEAQVELFRQALVASGKQTALLAVVDDLPLFDALRQRGLAIEREQQATWLLRSFDRRAESLERRLPKERFEFFMSDRF